MKTVDYIRKNAIIYERYKDQFDTLTEEQINVFREEVQEAFRKIPKSIQIEFCSCQPYETADQMFVDIRNNKQLRISSQNNDSKLLPGNLNLEFRAVHDYLHYVLQAPFGAIGEIAVFKLQLKHHESHVSKQILFSEVVLQACYFEHFGKFSDKQKVILI